jgi:hypothetical protein
MDAIINLLQLLLNFLASIAALIVHFLISTLQLIPGFINAIVKAAQ